MSASNKDYCQFVPDEDPFDLRVDLWDQLIPLESPEEAQERVANHPGRPDMLYRLAISLRHYGQPDRARSTVEKALAINPNYFEALELLASLLREKGDFQGTLGALNRAMAGRPNSPEIPLEIAQIHFLLRDYAKAREACQQVLKIQGSHFNSQLLTVYCFIREENLDQAIEWLERLVARRPRNGDLRYRLGLLLANRGDLERAVESFRATLEINPAMNDARRKLSHALFQSGRFEEAEIVLQDFLQDFPGYADSHYLLAHMLQIQGKYDRAREAFEHALIINSKYAEAHGDLGLLLEVQGESESALSHLRQARDLQPENVNAAIALAQALARRGEFEQALISLDEALARIPDSPELLHERGLILLRQGKTAEASEALGRAIESRPVLRVTHKRLLELYGRQSPDGDALERLHSMARARALERAPAIQLIETLGEQGREGDLLKVFVEMNSESKRPEFLFHRAMIEAQRGELETAADLLREILERDVRDVRAMYWLGLCLAVSGDFEASTQAYEAAILEDPLYVYVHETQGFAYGQAQSDADPRGGSEMAEPSGRDKAESFEHCAETHFSNGRYYAGLRDLKAALRLAPERPRTHHKLSIAYYDAYLWEDSQQESRLALAADPGYFRSHAVLAMLAEQRNDFRSARLEWKTFLSFCSEPRWKTKAFVRVRHLNV